MPLYPYRCTQCGHRFEKIQSFSAEPEKVCPQCGGPVERVLTAPRLQFKGAGWYVNDYASKSGAGATESAPAEGKGEAKKDAAAGSGTDAKPAAAAPGASSGASSGSTAGSGGASSGSSSPTGSTTS